MNKTLGGGSLILILALLAACTWVSLTPEGEHVRVEPADAVGNCVRKGKVTVSVKHQIGNIERSAEKVAGELASLARNEAALMSGNAVVAETPVADGRQVYGVYHCRRL